MSRGFLDEEAPAEDNDLGALDAREIEITCSIKARSGKAVQIDSGDRVLRWVPLSQIKGSRQDKPGIMTLRISEWWAKKNGLI